MKKKALKTLLTILITVLAAALLYLIMLINTNSVMREVRSAFLLELSPFETAGRPIDSYNYYWISERGRGVGRVDLSLARLFTFHNFSEGYIWILYSYTAYDDAGDLLTGSWRVPAKWKIERLNGNWEIVEIYEAP